MTQAVRVMVRDSARDLRRNPAAWLVPLAILTGTFAAILAFAGAVDSALLRPIRIDDPGELQIIAAADPRTGQPVTFPQEVAETVAAAVRSYSALSLYRVAVLRLTHEGATRDVGIEFVSPAYIDVVRLTLLGGHGFTNASSPSDPPEALMTPRLGNRLAPGRDLLGNTVTVEGRRVTVVGILRDEFRGLQQDVPIDLVMRVAAYPLLTAGAAAPVRAPYMVARLRDGVTPDQARAEIQTRVTAAFQSTGASRSAQEAPSARPAPPRIEVRDGRTGFSTVRELYGEALQWLLALAALLVLVGTINTAGLWTARALARQHQMAVRVALGADAATLRAHLVGECLVLVGSAFILAVPLAFAVTTSASAALSVARPFPLTDALDPAPTVLAAGAVLALVVGLAIGSTASVHALRGVDGLLTSSRTVPFGATRWAHTLVGVQVAVSVALVASASWFVASLDGLRQNHRSFGERQVLWTRLAPVPGAAPRPVDPGELRALHDRLARIPGVRQAALSSLFPGYLGFPGAMPQDRYGRPDAATSASAITERISPGFFDTFGIGMLRGRDVSWNDDAARPPVVVISAALAARLFPEGDALGRHVRLDGSPAELEVVGIVEDVPVGSIREPHIAAAYRPVTQDPSRAAFPMAHVLVDGNVAHVRDAYRRAVEDSGRYVVRQLFLLPEWVKFSLLQERFLAAIAAGAGGLSLLLTCVGLYALLARAVQGRTREIGVRLSLGATRGRIVRDVITSMAASILIGAVAGAVMATWIGNAARSRLYGVSATDLWPVALAVSLAVVTTAVAVLRPARAAASIDPAVALRQE